MRLPFSLLLLALTGCASASTPRASAPAAPSPSPAAAPASSDAIAARTSKLQNQDGFLPLHWDEKEGKLLLEIPRTGEELIYQVSLTAGVGSNADRPRPQPARRHAPRALRPRGAEGPARPGQHALPRASAAAPPSRRRSPSRSPRPSSGPSRSRPKRAGGSWSTPPTSSCATRTAWPRACATTSRATTPSTARAARSTCRARRPSPATRRSRPPSPSRRGDRPGPLVASVTPTPTTVTVRQHHSFVQLPPPGLHAAPPGSARGLLRHRGLRLREPVRGPAREALHRAAPPAEEGPGGRGLRGRAAHRLLRRQRRARSRSAAPSWRARPGGRRRSSAPGFHNAYEVRVLPEDADPMDVRYNVVNWVHRSTRGWSYGEALDRSAHGRDPEGQRDARLAAHPPGRR